MQDMQPYVRHVSCSMRRAAGGAVRRGISTGRSCRRIIWRPWRMPPCPTRRRCTATLPCIVSPDSGDGLEWTERGGRQFVLVCSMTDGEYAGVWTAGRQFVTDGYTLWVVLPYELEERMRRMPLMGDSLECRMRMLQLLGLPPDSPYDRLLFFYADRSTLLRPCPNPDVGACAAPDVSPGDLPAPYRKWFEARMALSYGEENPYPWTRLGYTYDWHRDAAQRRGLGEFIVPGGTEVIAVEQETVWRWYRGLVGIVRTDDTDGAGVRTGS